jgi:hypothetical protein
VRRTTCEIGDGALTDPAVIAEGLAQEDGWRGVTVGDGLDIHGRMYRIFILYLIMRFISINYLHGYVIRREKPQSLEGCGLERI